MDEVEAKVAVRIGAVVRRQRRALGLSQAELAERLGMSVDYVGLLERGERVPTVRMLMQMATGLGVPVAELLGAGPAVSYDGTAEAAALVASMGPDDREIALRILRALAYTADRAARAAEPSAPYRKR